LNSAHPDEREEFGKLAHVSECHQKNLNHFPLLIERFFKVRLTNSKTRRLAKLFRETICDHHAASLMKTRLLMGLSLV